MSENDEDRELQKTMAPIFAPFELAEFFVGYSRKSARLQQEIAEAHALLLQRAERLYASLPEPLAFFRNCSVILDLLTCGRGEVARVFSDNKEAEKCRDALLLLEAIWGANVRIDFIESAPTDKWIVFTLTIRHPRP